MYNLLVSYNGFEPHRSSMTTTRIFEYTDDVIAAHFRDGREIKLQEMIRLPALLMAEGTGDEVAHVVRIFAAHAVGNTITFEYMVDNAVPPLRNSMIYANRGDFGLDEYEFSRGHWAIKNVDLFRTLLRHARPGRQRPSVFQIPEHESIDPALVSVMMPFDAGFNEVYASIQQACIEAGLGSRRADDIWENPSIIQDIVSLIDRSRVVICDCTHKNANVFYEAGIAHALGREVILLTQSPADIPFDLRHLRYIHYLNNEQGRSSMAATLSARLRAILAG